MTRIERSKALVLALAAIVVTTGPLWTADGILTALRVAVFAANVAAAVFVVGVVVGWRPRFRRARGRR